MREPYDRLVDVVRSGQTVLPGDGSAGPEDPIWVQFARTMAPMMAPMAGPLGGFPEPSGRSSSAIWIRSTR